MKASELIEILQKKIAESGDLEVHCHDSMSGESEHVAMITTWKEMDGEQEKHLCFQIFGPHDAHELSSGADHEDEDDDPTEKIDVSELEP